MLNQVFMNILMNACQSMPDGGEITITTEFSGNTANGESNAIHVENGKVFLVSSKTGLVTLKDKITSADLLNMITINEVISDIPIRIQESLEQDENNTFTLKLRKRIRKQNFFWNGARYKNKNDD